MVATDEAVVAAVEDVVPVVAEHRDEGERNACLAPEVVQAAGSAGLFRLFAPAEVGGAEISLPLAADVFERLAGIDPALTWYMGNSSAVCYAAARLTDAERDEVFAEPDRNFGYSAAIGGRAVQDGSGFRLNGEWPLVTGVLDARWCALMGSVVDGNGSDPAGGGADLRQFLVPTEALEVDRVWDDAVAMRATGSHRVTATDVDLPRWCGKPMQTPLVVDRPPFRLGPALGGMTVNASIPTGILGTAVDAAAEILSTKVSTITGSVASQNVSILELVAEADAAHRTLRTSVIDAAATVWAAAQDGGRGTREQRARVHGLIHYASRVARETISQLYSRSSRVAFFRGHPLERALRDIHAVSYGLEPLRLFQHSAGLVRLDHPPEAPGF